MDEQITGQRDRLIRPLELRACRERPLVSVFIANYNYASYVGQAISSVVQQTYDAWELIVCDDGSTDSSWEVIVRYAGPDRRIKLVRTANNGQASAWNTAYSLSSGDIICTLDADDMFHHHKLAAIVEHFAQSPKVGLTIHPLMVIDRVGKPIIPIPFLSRFEEGWIAERLLRRGGRWSFLPASALCFRRELAHYIFPIPTDSFRRTADGFVFTLAPLLAPVSFIPEILGCYRVHGANGMSSSRMNEATARRVMSAIERVTDGVNQRLVELGFGDQLLDSRRNFTFLEQHFQIALFECRDRRELLKAFLGLSKRLYTDDQYSLLQRALRTAVYGIAILMPVSLRSLWLSQTIGFSRIKYYFYYLQNMVNRTWRSCLSIRANTD